MVQMDSEQGISPLPGGGGGADAAAAFRCVAAPLPLHPIPSCLPDIIYTYSCTRAAHTCFYDIFSSTNKFLNTHTCPYASFSSINKPLNTCLPPPCRFLPHHLRLVFLFTLSVPCVLFTPPAPYLLLTSSAPCLSHLLPVYCLPHLLLVYLTFYQFTLYLTCLIFFYLTCYQIFVYPSPPTSSLITSPVSYIFVYPNLYTPYCLSTSGHFPCLFDHNFAWRVVK